jgi:hypothetical protein
MEITTSITWIFMVFKTTLWQRGVALRYHIPGTGFRSMSYCIDSTKYNLGSVA